MLISSYQFVPTMLRHLWSGMGYTRCISCARRDYDLRYSDCPCEVRPNTRQRAGLEEDAKIIRFPLAKAFATFRARREREVLNQPREPQTTAQQIRARLDSQGNITGVSGFWDLGLEARRWFIRRMARSNRLTPGLSVLENRAVWEMRWMISTYWPEDGGAGQFSIFFRTASAREQSILRAYAGVRCCNCARTAPECRCYVTSTDRLVSHLSLHDVPLGTLKGRRDAVIPRPIGIELELAHLEHTPELMRVAEKWGITGHHDGSIRGRQPMEVVTPPLTGSDAIQCVRELCEALRGHARVNSSCGLHIHVDASGITADKLRKIATAYYAVEPALYAITKRDRWSNDYCMPWNRKFRADRHSTPREWSYSHDQIVTKGPAFSQNTHVHAERYLGLNLQSLDKHGTLEFRLFGAVNKPKAIITYAQLVSELIERAPKQTLAQCESKPLAAYLAGNQQQIEEVTRLVRRG